MTRTTINSPDFSDFLYQFFFIQKKIHLEIKNKKMDNNILEVRVKVKGIVRIRLVVKVFGISIWNWD